MGIKLFTFLILIFSSALLLQAQTLLLENFNYPAGDSLGAHGWVNFSGGATNVLTVVSPGLTYSGYPLSGIGNACRVLNSGQDDYKSFAVPDSSGSVYAAFIVRIDTAKTAGDYFFGLLPSTSTTSYTARIYAKDSANSLYFGLSKGAATQGPIIYSGNSFQFGVIYLLIVKYKFNTYSNTDDSLSLYVFSSGIPSAEPAVPSIGPVGGTGTDASNLGRVALRQGTASQAPILTIDGIKVTTTQSLIYANIKTIGTNADKFELCQNYPNPFNPGTTIKFEVFKVNTPLRRGEGGRIILKVYDILGKEVATLVNEKLLPGIYETNFSGNRLPSGIYFYKLETNEFTSVKKMILLK